jgi:hypothetical protein
VHRITLKSHDISARRKGAAERLHGIELPAMLVEYDHAKLRSANNLTRIGSKLLIDQPDKR